MALPSFDVFYRQNQKIWDGVAGMCLARAAGKLVYGESGNIRDQVDLDLTVPEPTFVSTFEPTFVSTFVAPRAVAQKTWPAAAPASS
jgi:fructose-1,6-bisphosphatase/inositol monophosphatase family enzyme